MKNSSSPTQSRPLVSCIMPTYNRVDLGAKGLEAPLVEEAICSFVSQDYPPDLCELIVLNDTPGQPIKDVPYKNVHVINFDYRFPSLGDKCNYGIKIATGNYVTRWDDDDISLPNRLKSVMAIVQRGDLDVLVVQGYFFQDVRERSWQVLTGKYGFQQDVYRRSIALKVKYESISNGEDQKFRAAMLAHPDTTKKFHFYPEPSELSYIYRWGLSQLHLSAELSTGEARYKQIGELPVRKLESPYVLELHWGAMYTEITKNLITKGQAVEDVQPPASDPEQHS